MCVCEKRKREMRENMKKKKFENSFVNLSNQNMRMEKKKRFVWMHEEKEKGKISYRRDGESKRVREQ